MALYEFTLRAETKTVDGIVIGRYGYAYKHCWGMHPGGRSRKVRAAESLASDAQYKNRAVRHFIVCDSFGEAAEGTYPVLRIEGEPPISFSDQPREYTVVGHLVKVGGRFTIRPVAQIAA